MCVFWVNGGENKREIERKKEGSLISISREIAGFVRQLDAKCQLAVKLFCSLTEFLLH